MTHSFLIIGQSNMAGRGFIKDVSPIYDEHIKMLINGRWQTMFEPINTDRPTSGIGPAPSFAAAWRLKNEAEDIGLIPCADGGSSLDEWEPGSALFENAIGQVLMAKQTSTLEGILWHQGENDSFGGRSASYLAKFSAIVSNLRSRLGADLPVIVGGLGDFLVTGRYGQYFTEVEAVNKALVKLPESIPGCFFVTAANLLPNPDGLHFCAASQRIFGIRYFEAWHNRVNVYEPILNEQEIVETIDRKPLSKNYKIASLEIKFGKGELSLKDYELRLSEINSQ
jgi:hypothetical protein